MIQNETVGQMWESFAAAVLPADVSRVQRIETRRAFYAGAFTMLLVVRKIGEDEVSEADGIAWLESLKAELDAFYALVKAGKA